MTKHATFRTADEPFDMDAVLDAAFKAVGVKGTPLNDPSQSYLARAKARLEAARECAEKGMSIADTARQLGLSKGYIRQLGKKNGLPFATRPLCRDYDKGKILSMIEQGHKYKVIAHACGVSPATVSNVALANGMRRRK